MNTTTERGSTLVELAVVVVLAAVVGLGLVTFYLNAQATWIDASTQAITQREGTLLIQDMSANIRVGNHVQISNSPDPQHQMLQVYDKDNNELYRYWWDSGDSLIHRREAGADRDPIGQSRVRQFAFSGAAPLVQLTNLELRSAKGQIVNFATSFGTYNP
jgi:type II secretory pathway pseudopilin PulG